MVPWTYVINDLNGEEIINYMSNGKVMIIHLIAGLIKRVSVILLNEIPLYKMSKYFRKPYKPFVGDMNVKVDLSNYATKADIENISHVDSSSFPLKINLASLKTEVDKLEIDKLVPIPVDLSKLKKMMFLKRTDMINWFLE